MGVDYVPVVWVNVIKSDEKVKNVERAVAEITKYAVKAADYIVKDKAGFVDEELTDEFVSTLDAAFCNRRLVAFGGDFKKVQRFNSIVSMGCLSLAAILAKNSRVLLSMVIFKIAVFVCKLVPYDCSCIDNYTFVP